NVLENGLRERVVHIGRHYVAGREAERGARTPLEQARYVPPHALRVVGARDRLVGGERIAVGLRYPEGLSFGGREVGEQRQRVRVGGEQPHEVAGYHGRGRRAGHRGEPHVVVAGRRWQPRGGQRAVLGLALDAGHRLLERGGQRALPAT